MSKKRKGNRRKIIRYDNLEDIPVKPRNRKLIAMGDAEVERRAAADPDAGVIGMCNTNNVAKLTQE